MCHERLKRFAEQSYNRKLKEFLAIFQNYLSISQNIWIENQFSKKKLWATICSWISIFLWAMNFIVVLDPKIESCYDSHLKWTKTNRSPRCCRTSLVIVGVHDAWKRCELASKLLQSFTGMHAVISRACALRFHQNNFVFICRLIEAKFLDLVRTCFSRGEYSSSLYSASTAKTSTGVPLTISEKYFSSHHKACKTQTVSLGVTFKIPE